MLITNDQIVYNADLLEACKDGTTLKKLQFVGMGHSYLNGAVQTNVQYLYDLTYGLNVHDVPARTVLEDIRDRLDTLIDLLTNLNIR